MGLYNGSLANYYGGLEEYGAYQFISITDIINNFRVAYVGEDKVIAKISRGDIRFHAMRGLQELTYDTFRSCKTLELEIPPSLVLPLPHDYVEYVKISWIDSDGKCHTIRQCKTCPKDPLSYKQHDGEDGKHEEGDIDVGSFIPGEEVQGPLLEAAHGQAGTWDPVVIKWFTDPETGVTSPVEWSTDIYDSANWGVWIDDIYGESTTNSSWSQNPTVEDSTTWSNLSDATTSVSTSDDVYQPDPGARYGLDPQHANVNGCFWINCRTGQIYFDSSLAGKTVTIQYISDTAATDGEMLVHKFAEEAMYRHIAWSILNTRANVDGNIVSRYKKERFAAVRNAKIRLSSIKLEEITQILRGKSKWIKH